MNPPLRPVAEARPGKRRLALALALAAALVGLLLVRLGCAPEGASVPRWYDQTARAVAAAREADGASDAVASRTWAVAWTAAEQALEDDGRGGDQDGSAAEPDSEPDSQPDTQPDSQPDSEVEDAVAGAVSGVLLVLVPSRGAAVRRAVDAGCSDGPAFARGRTEAGRVLAERAGDGIGGVDPPVALPLAPGRWRPTPPSFAPYGGAGLARARPFVPATARLSAVPAPALGSARYRRDLAEVAALGAATSTVRTQAQTATARYWAPSSVVLFTGVLRPVVRDLPPRDAVRLLARLHRATTDATLAVARAKRAGLRWRPVTALREDGDGDPLTPRLPGWTPLVETPPNPEHPSGHTAYAAAAAGVLEDLVDDRPVSAGGRRWTSWQQLVRENEDARVWAGLHLRSSDEAGSALGRLVAETG